jgi:hypothetical protein
MANNQQPLGRGNTMAALLGNMGQPAAGQPQPQANYGGGLQPPMQGLGGRGGPDMMNALLANATQPLSGQQQQQAGARFANAGQRMPEMQVQPFAPGSPEMQQWNAVLGTRGGGAQAPTQPGAWTNMANMPAQGQTVGYESPAQQQWNTAQQAPSTGAPGGGAGGGKGQVKQAIGQLPGGPPMQSRLGGALGNRMRRPRMPGMQANPALMRQGQRR